LALVKWLQMRRIGYGGCSTSGFSRKWLLFSDSSVRWPGVYPDSDPVVKPCPKVHALQSLYCTNNGLSSKTNTRSWPSKSIQPGPEGQAKLLLQINALVAEIRDAPATTTEDFLALLDVALDHELDLASDIAFYGPADYPMITRLFRALARKVPDFEFNSLRRWLSSPGQFEQLMGDATPFESEGRTSGERVEPTVLSKLIRLARNGYK